MKLAHLAILALLGPLVSCTTPVDRPSPRDGYKSPTIGKDA